MNVHADPNRDTADYIAEAERYFEQADALCQSHGGGSLAKADDGSLAMAQVQATIGVGQAVLALAQQLYDDGGGDLPISGSIPLTPRAEP